jgi:predicted RNA-binding Zn-ribbon protein involved in translation (DUF1610 family)
MKQILKACSVIDVKVAFGEVLVDILDTRYDISINNANIDKLKINGKSYTICNKCGSLKRVIPALTIIDSFPCPICFKQEIVDSTRKKDSNLEYIKSMYEELTP